METDEKDNGHDNENDKLQWHPAFLQAMQLELSDYRDILEFKYDYSLTSGSLRIDLLIIKKLKDMVINKNIARIFRSHNVLEYKSPDDNLSVNDFLKVYAYANLYAAITPGVDFSDITITFVETRHPHKLLQYLAETRCYTIIEASPGIYHVSGDYVPIQIIESKKLSEKENLWLKSLTNDLKFRDRDVILEAARKRRRREEIDAYLDVILYANPETFLEVQKMGKAAFEKVFTEAGIIPEWIERGRVQGIERGRAAGMEEEKLEIARKMKAAGRPPAEITQFTGLSVETIKQMSD